MPNWVRNIIDTLALKEDKANKGASGGYAPLNGTGKIPPDNLGTGPEDDKALFGDQKFKLPPVFVGLAKITVGTTPPDSPSIGDLWVDCS